MSKNSLFSINYVIQLNSNLKSTFLLPLSTVKFYFHLNFKLDFLYIEVQILRTSIANVVSFIETFANVLEE